MRGSWAAVLALDEPLNPLRDFMGRRYRFLNPCYHDFQLDLLSSRDFRSILSTRLSLGQFGGDEGLDFLFDFIVLFGVSSFLASAPDFLFAGLSFIVLVLSERFDVTQISRPGPGVRCGS